jgi:hypothetical protein
MWGFFSVQAICALAAWKHGITWPTAALSGGAFLVYVGAISTEKILLKWLENMKLKILNGLKGVKDNDLPS